MSGSDSGLPAGLRPYKRTPVFDENTIPAALGRRHSTKAGVWGLIRVVEGRLRYRILEPPAEMILDPAHSGIVKPMQPHQVEPLGTVRFFVEFHADAASAQSTGTGRDEIDGTLPHE